MEVNSSWSGLIQVCCLTRKQLWNCQQESAICFIKPLRSLTYVRREFYMVYTMKVIHLSLQSERRNRQTDSDFAMIV